MNKYINTCIEFNINFPYLYYINDYSIKEISKIINIPAGTVKSRLSRAREKIQFALKDFI